MTWRAMRLALEHTYYMPQPTIETRGILVECPMRLAKVTVFV